MASNGTRRCPVRGGQLARREDRLGPQPVRHHDESRRRAGISGGLVGQGADRVVPELIHDPPVNSPYFIACP
jgi:hypothetical protein